MKKIPNYLGSARLSCAGIAEKGLGQKCGTCLDCLSFTSGPKRIGPFSALHDTGDIHLYMHNKLDGYIRSSAACVVNGVVIQPIDMYRKPFVRLCGLECAAQTMSYTEMRT
jgi:hypothetical protein